MGVIRNPFENDPPLVVNSNAIKGLEFSRKFFQSVRWRNFQVRQVNRVI